MQKEKKNNFTQKQLPLQKGTPINFDDKEKNPKH